MAYPHPYIRNQRVVLDRRPRLNPLAKAVLVCQHFRRLGLELRWRSLPRPDADRVRAAQANLQAMTESIAKPIPYEVLPE